MLIVLKNATIVTGNGVGAGTVVVEDDRIRSVVYDGEAEAGQNESCQIDAEASLGEAGCVSQSETGEAVVMDLRGKLLFAGGIDAHVHFREPGMTAKADMESESKAAVMGGVTSFIDMPNTRPATTSLPLLEEKAALAEGRVYANYGFHLGATNENAKELKKAVAEHPQDFGGIKVFMGSSTGNMLVDNGLTLKEIFSTAGKPVLVHCEDEKTIRDNLQQALAQFGEQIPVSQHPLIRSREACIASSAVALQLAVENGTALHLLHVSTAEEVDMIAEARRKNPRITAETTINYLWFSDEDYPRLGAKIKCNPAIKTSSDRKRLIEALKNGEIDTIGSDHAPHLELEKAGLYREIPSGIPSIQQTLPVLLTIAQRENIPLERIARVFSEKAAEMFGIRDRGRIAPGCFADLVVVDPEKEWTVTREELQGKCGWSPYEGELLKGRIETVLVNGKITVSGGKLVCGADGKRLKFN